MNEFAREIAQHWPSILFGGAVVFLLCVAVLKGLEAAACAAGLI